MELRVPEFKSASIMKRNDSAGIQPGDADYKADSSLACNVFENRGLQRFLRKYSALS